MIKNHERPTELLKLISDNEETIIPYDKIKTGNRRSEKEYGIPEHLIQNKKSISDTLFLSAILFTLTKFIYNKDILVTKLKENNQRFNKLIIAKSIDTKITVRDYLNQMEDLIAKIEQYDSNSFDKVKEQLDLDLSHFQYYYQKYHYQRDDEKCDHDFDIPESDFTVIINEVNESEIKIKIFYNSNLYNEKTVQLFYNSLLIILKEFKNENKLLKDIGIGLRIDEIIKKEIDKFIEPEQFLLNELFEKVVIQNRDKIALITSDRSLTFDKLNREANKIANNLLKNGLNIGDRVIIKLERSVNLVIAIFGVMKAGGTFIIVSPDDPIQRVELIKKDTDAEYIIDGGNIDNFKTGSDGNPKIDLKPDDMFCIIYTSGSTGKPKGVMVTHKSMAYTLKIPEYNMISKNDRYLLMTQPIFVVFTKDLFIFLFKGLTIVIPNDTHLQNPLSLLELYEFSKFNILNTTPSRLSAMLEDFQNIIKKMKVILLGGEILTKQFLDRIKKVTNARIFNPYGLTECSGFSNVNILFIVMDVDGNPLPNGIVGELWMGGYGVTKGYWNNEKLTEEKYTTVDSIPFLKTGDLAKYNENGEYNIIGRLDNQIKLRGQRIDPGEIYNNVPTDIGIEKVIVIVNKKDDNQFLVLYFTTKSKFLKSDEINKLKEDIEKNLKTKLPQYMVPQVYVYLGEFPKTPTGKISVKDLKNYDDSVNEIIKPSDGLEQELFDICAEILGHTNFGVANNLLSIGFTSLSINQLANKVLNKYCIELRLNDLMSTNINIKDLSKLIKKYKPVSYGEHELRDYYPLTPQQYSYLNRIQLGEPSITLLISGYFIFGDLNPYKLKNALINLINRNNIFKIHLVNVNGIIYQKINDKLEFEINIYNKKLNEDILSNFVKDFDLFKDPLFNFEIYHHNKQVYIVHSIHHLIFDGYSNDIFETELFNLYYSESIPEKYDYFDYCIDLEESEKNRDEISKKYLKKNLGKIPFSYYLNDTPQTKRNSDSIIINYDNFDLVNKFCKKYNISHHHLFLASTVLALTNFNNNKNVILETIFNGHTNPKYYNTIGLFADSFPLFFNIDYNIPLNNYLKEVMEKFDNAINNPPSKVFHKFSQMLSDLNPMKTLYEFSYLIENKFILDKKVEGMTNHDIDNITKNELLIRVIKPSNQDVFKLILLFNSNYHSYQDFEDLINHIIYLLEKIILNYSKNISYLMK
ncbi:MAG: AMP-binding protein [Methanobrevibacter sp.]|nr:AMP-binding protein [Candidatus Methanovirga australis]